MANLQEIRSKISSVKNLQKMTQAMEMVARSKIGKIIRRMESARPFGDKIRLIASHMHHAHIAYHSPYLAQRSPTKRVVLILVTTDRGMCGGLNSRLFRQCLPRLQEWHKQNIGVTLAPFGQQGLSLARRLGLPLLTSAVGLGDLPDMERLIGPLGVILQAFREGDVDAVFLAYTRFDNILVQKPVLEALLPLSGERLGTPSTPWDYLYEPDSPWVVDRMLQRYLETLLWLALAENMASEQAARMMAMKSASDNAKEALGDLNHLYHRSRQEQITRELIEIVSGAAALVGTS